jgi:hypothetical protein
MQKEPITGLKKVKIQNAIEEYRHRMKQERYFDMVTHQNDQDLVGDNQHDTAKN